MALVFIMPLPGTEGMYFRIKLWNVWSVQTQISQKVAFYLIAHSQREKQRLLAKLFSTSKYEKSKAFFQPHLKLISFCSGEVVA